MWTVLNLPETHFTQLNDKEMLSIFVNDGTKPPWEGMVKLSMVRS